MLLDKKFRICTDNKTIMCKSFNTDRVLIWQFIPEQYGLYIEYIKGDKNIVAEEISRFSLNRNQETTQKYTYQKKIIPEIKYIEEQPEISFPINIKLIQKYQQTEPSIIDKYKYGK